MIARNQQQTDEEYADYHAYSNQNYLREGSMGDARGNIRLFPKMVQREYYTPIDYSGGITHRNMEGNGGPLGRQFNSIALGEDTRRQHNKSAMYAPVRPIGSGSSGGMRYAREDDRHYSSSDSDSSDDEEMSGCGVPGHRKLLKHLSKMKLPKDVHNEVCEWLEDMEKSGRGLEGRGGVWDWIKGAVSKVGNFVKPIAQVAMPLIKTFTPYGKIIGAVSEGAKALIPGAEEKLAEYGLGYRGNGVVVVPSPERGNSLSDVRSIGNGFFDKLDPNYRKKQIEKQMNENKAKINEMSKNNLANMTQGDINNRRAQMKKQEQIDNINSEGLTKFNPTKEDFDALRKSQDERIKALGSGILSGVYKKFQENSERDHPELKRKREEKEKAEADKKSARLKPLSFQMPASTGSGFLDYDLKAMKALKEKKEKMEKMEADKKKPLPTLASYGFGSGASGGAHQFLETNENPLIGVPMRKPGFMKSSGLRFEGSSLGAGALHITHTGGKKRGRPRKVGGSVMGGPSNDPVNRGKITGGRKRKTGSALFKKKGTFPLETKPGEPLTETQIVTNGKLGQGRRKKGGADNGAKPDPISPLYRKGAVKEKKVPVTTDLSYVPFNPAPETYVDMSDSVRLTAQPTAKPKKKKSPSPPPRPPKTQPGDIVFPHPNTVKSGTVSSGFGASGGKLKTLLHSSSFSGGKKTSPWIQHCKAYASAHGVSYKQAMKDAKASYRK